MCEVLQHDAEGNHWQCWYACFFFIFTFCVKHPFGFDGIRVLGGFFISSMDNETYSFDLSYRLYLFFQRNKLDLISKYAQPPGTTIIIMSTKRIHDAQDMSSLFFTKKQSWTHIWYFLIPAQDMLSCSNEFFFLMVFASNLLFRRTASAASIF